MEDLIHCSADKGKIKKVSNQADTSLPHPVILKVDEGIRKLPAKARQMALSKLARNCLELPCKVLGIELKELQKDASGKPLPCRGYYWSISHKRRYVCGAIHHEPIGVDVEEIKKFKKELFSKVATTNEWALFRERNDEAFARLWSAKEAALKLRGIGLPEFRFCKLVELSNHNVLILTIQAEFFYVEQRLQDEHVFSICIRKK